MPYYRFKMSVPITPQQVIERIEKVVIDERLLKNKKTSVLASWSLNLPIVPIRKELFLGTVDKSSFSAVRIINYRNSFLPVINGKVTPTAQGSQVSIQMNLHFIVLMFLSFWLAGVVFFAVAYSYSNLDFSLSMETIFPALFPLLGLLLISLGFIPEVIIAKRLLSKAIMADQ